MQGFDLLDAARLRRQVALEGHLSLQHRRVRQLGAARCEPELDGDVEAHPALGREAQRDRAPALRGCELDL